MILNLISKPNSNDKGVQIYLRILHSKNMTNVKL